MPNIKGHLAIAAAATTAVFYLNAVPTSYLTPALISGIGIGTILPDLDHQSSTVNQKLLLINKKWFQILVYAGFSAAIIYYLGYQAKAILGAVVVFLTGFLPHRAFTHKLGGLLLICTTIVLFLGIKPISLGIAAGMMMHVLSDKIKDWLF